MPETTAITVAVGHFDDLLARGLRGLVEDDPSLELVAADVAPAQLAPVLQARRPRVAILDPGTLHSPVEVRELSTSHPATHLLLLADQPSGVECAQLLAFGAAACLAKATQVRDVLNAIHLASRGLQLLPRDGYGSIPGSGLLTARETDVLAQLQQRRSNAQIAAELHISIETVRTHARHIYRKLGVASRRELL
ncbi:MAG TPA: response regulator transcription factor [Solirubrobacteraceae bacterium]|jgi:DNA-binding NarL/FixJ family response regulator|nr:response regulator transcription factor [Solirubrobacteraceae bacterium]